MLTIILKIQTDTSILFISIHASADEKNSEATMKCKLRGRAGSRWLATIPETIQLVYT